MRSKNLLIVFLMLAQNIHALEFIGEAFNFGEDYLGCGNIERPRYFEAEADSEKQAKEFCDTFNQDFSRVSEFFYEEDCQLIGKGFSRSYRKTLRATALYRCIEKI